MLNIMMNIDQLSTGEGNRVRCAAYCLGYFRSAFDFRLLHTGQRLFLGKVTGRLENLLDSLLGPFEIFLDLFGGLHAVSEVGTGAFQSSLCECLQFG